MFSFLSSSGPEAKGNNTWQKMFALIKPPECQDGLIKVIVPDLSSKF